VDGDLRSAQVSRRCSYDKTTHPNSALNSLMPPYSIYIDISGECNVEICKRRDQSRRGDMWSFKHREVVPQRRCQGRQMSAGRCGPTLFLINSTLYNDLNVCDRRSVGEANVRFGARIAIVPADIALPIFSYCVDAAGSEWFIAAYSM
jgi:hypothetical protein